MEWGVTNMNGNWGKAILIAGALVLAAAPAQAGSPNDGIEKAGVIVSIVLPTAAGGISLYKNDWQGLAQLATVTAATVGSAYLLKHVVHEERPDGSNDQSFPSDTAALAFAPASYLWDRYGWEYGAPAYAAAAFVGYSRVESKQHHWWDVATSAGMAWGFSQLVTSRYHDYGNLQAGLYATPEAAFVSVDYKF
jgi:membrane-associated phospholipid phosphatase